MGVFPTDRECFIHLQSLACLHTAAAQDALVRVVPIEGVRVVDFVRFRSIRYLLMFNLQQFGCVVNGAVTVVIIANGTVEKMVAQDPVERFSPGRFCLCRCRNDPHPFRYGDTARASELAANFHQASIAALNRAKLRMVADLRKLFPNSIDYVDQVFALCCFIGGTVDNYL